MPTIRTIEPHGPDHYRQLLERSDENEILKPNRSKASLKIIRTVRVSWDRFCREILGPDVDQVERLRTIRLRDIQVYMRWLLDTSNIQRLGAMESRMKVWLMMYRDEVGHPLDVNMRSQMNTYYNTTLKNDFKLDPTRTPKESINVDDLHHLLKFLWTRDTHVYPVERQRVQQALITLLIALTTVRPGAIVESSSYYGTNEALLYRDVALRLVRDPAEPSQAVLLMEVTVRLWKGYREKEKPVTFVFYEHDCLIFCPILYFLSLAFADNAFDSECIQCVEDIYRHTIPEFKESTLLKWKESWLTRPVFRRACIAGSGLATSAIKALPYNCFVSQTKALGQGAGFRADLNPYAFRRGAAQVVNKIATTAERNQIIEHSRADIYEKHYQNRVVNIDIAAAILKTPSRSSLLESVGHIGLDRDPRVPQMLDQKERDAVLADPELIQLIAEIKDYRASVPRQAFCNSKDPEKRTPEWRHLRNLQARRIWLRKKLLRQATAKKRRQFFANVDNQDIRQSRLGMPITHNPSTPLYSLPPRANLAEIFSQEDTENTRPYESNRRREALQNLIKLCQMREPHPKNPASSLKWESNIPVQEGDSGLEGAPMEDDLRDMKEAFENMELIPLKLPSTMCLFCLGDSELSSVARTASFSRIDSLRRHVDDLHLSHYDHDAPVVCPHPTCDTSLQGVNRFKNHAATVHNVFLSK